MMTRTAPALAIAANVREAEHYKRQTSAARTLHAVRMAAGSACNIANNSASGAPVGLSAAELTAGGVTEAIARDMASLHRIAADAAGIARARFREDRDMVTAGAWEATRDRHLAGASNWGAIADRLAAL